MSSYKVKKTFGDTSWFIHDRFGMFIHWGLYSLPARHEWIKYFEQISDEDYNKYFEYFDPDMFDPVQWAKKAKAAGMKYAVLTTKHHEGFCLFDTKYTDFKATNTKAGRDLVKEYVEAFRAEGLKIGFYYSLIDWHHPEFTIDYRHPLCDDPRAEEMNKSKDMKKYAEYMRNQLTELMTNYGKIDILWLDFSYGDEPDNPHWKPWMKGKGADDWESEKLIATVRKYQPDIIIDNRSDIDQDIWTPEQFQPTEWPTHKVTGELVPWEACQTFSGSWGYFRDETNWKSEKMVVEMLIKTVALGGNLIMNVGPTSRGYIDKRAEKMLDAYAEWMKYNSRSIYGCTKAEPEFTAPDGCALTQSDDGSRLYIHILNYPFQNLKMDCIAGKIDYAQFLHDGSEVSFKEKADCNWDVITNTFWLPTVKPDVLIPVIEVFLKKENS